METTIKTGMVNEMISYKELFDKPKIIGVVADINQGKSMLLYHILESLALENKFKLFTYGLRLNVKGSKRIYSVKELEGIRDSIIVVDELSSLFDLDNRKVKRSIENTLRLLNHNNNVLVLCGTPENFKKFISAKINVIFYKKTTIADFINGSRLKSVLLQYKGDERGTELLNLKVGEALFFDGQHYTRFDVPYLERYDSKKSNVKIVTPKVKNANKMQNVRKRSQAKSV